ncbi:hypothetical protein BGX23_009055 [Mortierella sp. AD031]|nr:hypothetical protein BGX23_009055 [Mortierella sp. AD031]
MPHEGQRRPLWQESEPHDNYMERPPLWELDRLPQRESDWPSRRESAWPQREESGWPPHRDWEAQTRWERTFDGYSPEPFDYGHRRSLPPYQARRQSYDEWRDYPQGPVVDAPRRLPLPTRRSEPLPRDAGRANSRDRARPQQQPLQGRVTPQPPAGMTHGNGHGQAQSSSVTRPSSYPPPPSRRQELQEQQQTNVQPPLQQQQQQQQQLLQLQEQLQREEEGMNTEPNPLRLPQLDDYMRQMKTLRSPIALDHGSSFSPTRSPAAFSSNYDLSSTTLNDGIVFRSVLYSVLPTRSPAGFRRNFDVLPTTLYDGRVFCSVLPTRFTATFASADCAFSPIAHYDGNAYYDGNALSARLLATPMGIDLDFSPTLLYDASTSSPISPATIEYWKAIDLTASASTSTRAHLLAFGEFAAIESFRPVDVLRAEYQAELLKGPPARDGLEDWKERDRWREVLHSANRAADDKDRDGRYVDMEVELHRARKPRELHRLFLRRQERGWRALRTKLAVPKRIRRRVIEFNRRINANGSSPRGRRVTSASQTIAPSQTIRSSFKPTGLLHRMMTERDIIDISQYVGPSRRARKKRAKKERVAARKRATLVIDYSYGRFLGGVEQFGETRANAVDLTLAPGEVQRIRNAQEQEPRSNSSRSKWRLVGGVIDLTEEQEQVRSRGREADGRRHLDTSFNVALGNGAHWMLYASGGLTVEREQAQTVDRFTQLRINNQIQVVTGPSTSSSSSCRPQQAATGGGAIASAIETIDLTVETDQGMGLNEHRPVLSFSQLKETKSMAESLEAFNYASTTFVSPPLKLTIREGENTRALDMDKDEVIDYGDDHDLDLADDREFAQFMQRAGMSESTMETWEQEVIFDYWDLFYEQRLNLLMKRREERMRVLKYLADRILEEVRRMGSRQTMIWTDRRWDQELNKALRNFKDTEPAYKETMEQLAVTLNVARNQCVEWTKDALATERQTRAQLAAASAK